MIEIHNLSELCKAIIVPARFFIAVSSLGVHPLDYYKVSLKFQIPVHDNLLLPPMYTKFCDLKQLIITDNFHIFPFLMDVKFTDITKFYKDQVKKRGNAFFSIHDIMITDKGIPVNKQLTPRQSGVPPGAVLQAIITFNYIKPKFTEHVNMQVQTSSANLSDHNNPNPFQSILSVDLFQPTNNPDNNPQSTTPPPAHQN